MQIHLNLKKHCIQTAAKTAHERLVRACLARSGDAETEAMLQALQLFMETADFARLRSEYPPLCGGAAEAVLKTDETNRRMSLHFGGTALDLN